MPPAGAPAPHPAVAHLRTQWAAQAAPGALAAWTVLDTDFGTTRTFLELWQCWRSQAHRPHMLHYVGVLSAAQATQLAQALQTLDATPLSHLAATLATDCYGLGDGFHRILPVLRGVADIVLFRPDDRGKALLQGGDDNVCIIHRQRGLRDIGKFHRRITNAEF